MASRWFDSLRALVVVSIFFNFNYAAHVVYTSKVNTTIAQMTRAIQWLSIHVCGLETKVPIGLTYITTDFYELRQDFGIQGKLNTIYSHK